MLRRRKSLIHAHSFVLLTYAKKLVTSANINILVDNAEKPW